MLELVGFGTDPDAAAEAATRLGGMAYVNHPTERDGRPYSAMIRAATDDVEAVRSVSDVGMYVCFSRVIKEPVEEPTVERSIATFGLVRNSAMTHRQCDDHWRDTHGPLALQMHLAMCDYSQLAVVDTIHGQQIDGIAMCAFSTRSDLSTKFFNDDDAKRAIIKDVTTFSDAAGSPPRVVLQQLI
ncbi:MAG: EthD domain-containing protein [Acidimicrobiales bacterium]|jgi:hypothetical protein